MYDNYQKHIQEQKARIAASYGVPTDITDSALIKSEVDELEKSGRGAPIGTKKLMGGRMYIKTHDGWKYHGQGTGHQAQQHVASTYHDSGEHISDEAKAAFADTIKNLQADALRNYLANIRSPSWGKEIVRAELASRRAPEPAPNLVATNHIASPEERQIARANAKKFTTSDLEGMRDNNTSPQWIKDIVAFELDRRQGLQAWTEAYNKPTATPEERALAAGWIEHHGGTIPQEDDSEIKTPSTSETFVSGISDLSEDLQNAIFHMSYRQSEEGTFSDEDLDLYAFEDNDAAKDDALLFFEQFDVQSIFKDDNDLDEDQIDGWVEDREAEGFDVVETEQGFIASKPKVVQDEPAIEPIRSDFQAHAIMPVTFDHRDIEDGMKQFNDHLKALGGRVYDAGAFTAISNEPIDDVAPFDDPNVVIIDTDDMSALEIADAYDQVFKRYGYTVTESPDDGSDTFAFDIQPIIQKSKVVENNFNKIQSAKILSIYK